MARPGAGLSCGGRIVTDARSNAAAVTCCAAESTLPELAKTCCGTTVANRRFANCASATCDGSITFRMI